MSDVNPNVEVGEESTVAGGFGEDGLTSFDEIEALDDSATSEQAKAAEPAEEVEKQAKESVSNDTQKDELSAETNTKEETAEEKIERKMLEAMLGDETHEIAEDTVFKQKVNGEEQEVTIRELLNDYSGRTDWNRKYSELGEERQALKKSEIEFSTRVDTFVSKSKENVLDALAYLAETSGADPVEFIKDLKQGLVPDLEEYMGMSQSEKEAYDYKQELDILKKSRETKESSEAKVKELLELDVKTMEQIESLGIDQKEYVAAYDRLVEHSGISPDQIGPETVAQWIGMENRVALVDNALMEIDSNLADDVALIEDLVKTSLEGGLDEQSTIEVINEIYGQPSKEAKSASEKVRQSKSNLKNVTKKLTEDSGQGDYSESSSDLGPLSFDDV